MIFLVKNFVTTDTSIRTDALKNGGCDRRAINRTGMQAMPPIFFEPVKSYREA